MRISDFITALKIKLQTVYDEREAENIAHYLPEELFGKTFVRTNSELKEEQLDILQIASSRLLNYEPIQYILGEAWFYGKKFKVESGVLIPRPETEELIEFIISENKKTNPAILDIGTGSGCIPVILKSEIPKANIFALDISEKALQIAEENANLHKTEIQFIQCDILNPGDLIFQQFDLIVSNPPYVDPAEASALHKNILDFEPHLALFGAKEEPFIFYTVISDFAFKYLAHHGKLFFELPENKGELISSIVTNAGLRNIKIKCDLQGKERMLMAEKI